MYRARHINSALFTPFAATGLLALTALLTLPGRSAQAGPVKPTVTAYLSAPNTQFVPASITGAVSETFNTQTADVYTYTDAAPFSSAIGNYSGQFAVVADNQYGTGTGNYFALGAQSSSSTPVTLTFTNPIQYFGMSYNAGDNNNGFTF